MFDFDSLREIVSTIKKNKTRTILTGFAVAWGIFMLIVLLGSGNGLQNGMQQAFAHRAQNAVRLWSGWTSMPYKGLPEGRSINFDYRDMNMLRKEMPEIEYLSAGIGRSVTLSYGKENTSVQIQGITADGAFINNLTVSEGNGRFINKLDDDHRRKVIVLHPNHAKVLFKDEDPLGKYVIANNKIAYKVIGLYNTENVYDSNPATYIPLTVAQIFYNRWWGYWFIEFTVKGLNTMADNEAFNERVREKMGQLHTFDPKDRSALYIWNSAENAIQTMKMGMMIQIFIVIIGLASLMAGIVGVGNIMLITVKERTREIGIRKSLGATPWSILWLIILEAIFITTVAGYLGIVAGVGLTEFVSAYMFDGSEGGRAIFINPTVNIGVVIWATVLLIVCGVIAGLIPAVKATKVSPIEAMRAD